MADKPDWNERIPLSRRAAAVLAAHAKGYSTQMRRYIAEGEAVTPEFLANLEEVERAAEILWGQVQNSPVPMPGDRRGNREYQQLVRRH